MAQGGIQIHEEKLCCSVCLDLLKDPVTIPCGHNYCMSCINRHWDGEDQMITYSCPQCREMFSPRPVLVKNTMLADVVEDLKKTGLQAAPADHCYAGPEDVTCDICTGRKLKALKSCLQCLVSYCEQHLQPHHESPAFEKHKLVDPSTKLQESICTHHNEVMKIFCRTDHQCICYVCFMDEHKGHDTVSAAAEMTERQKELGASRQKIQQRIQKREEDVKVLQQEAEAINRCADKAVSDSRKIFTDLIRLIEKISSDVKQQIRSQQKSKVSRVEELQEKLQQEIAELSSKDAELEQLSRTEDHTRFLWSYPSLADLGESTHSPSIIFRPLQYFEDVTVAVTKARDKLQAILGEGWAKISLTARSEYDLLLQTEPKTRSAFLQYSCQITLDPITAHKQLSLSKGNRKVTVMRKEMLYLQHPDRFTLRQNVLSKDSLTGRCYCEMEVREATIAVAYKNISRKGAESGFGHNNKSWALQCFDDGYEFRHNNIRTSIPVPQFSRVGVYLDHSAGILSFYSVSDTMTLLHRVQTTFTQPLHIGLCIYGYDHSVELCELRCYK